MARQVRSRNRAVIVFEAVGADAALREVFALDDFLRVSRVRTPAQLRQAALLRRVLAPGFRAKEGSGD